MTATSATPLPSRSSTHNPGLESQSFHGATGRGAIREARALTTALLEQGGTLVATMQALSERRYEPDPKKEKSPKLLVDLLAPDHFEGSKRRPQDWKGAYCPKYLDYRERS